MSSPSTERSIFMVEAVPVRRKRQRTAEWALTKSCGEGGARAGRGWGEGGARVGRGCVHAGWGVWRVQECVCGEMRWEWGF